ncbi:hypothetical protein [Cupriavidus sp. DF5525]|uniref:hypothetical protein n=1 Tax=Cupriavidus sp. DF5525 TaxID=3160989 RepID=UPI0032DEC40B
MSALNKHELQIVQAFSSVSVPEKLMRDSNIEELIKAMLTEQEAVQNDARRLERLRQERKDGNWFGNVWNDRDEKVQDANIDLNRSIGRLTQKSSQLLVVNTAISKVLTDQQRMLLWQQDLLKQQADELEEQNKKILDQQHQLSEQQIGLNAANKGLMEAKGITQEHAQKLVGCVVRVTEAEKKIDSANAALRAAVEQRVGESISQCIAQVDGSVAELHRTHDAFGKQIADLFAGQLADTEVKLAQFAKQADSIKASVEQQLQAHLDATTSQLNGMDASIAQLHQRHDVVGEQMTEVSEQLEATQAKLVQFSSHADSFTAGIEQQLQAHIEATAAELNGKVQALNEIESGLASLASAQERATKRHRLTLGLVAGISVLSLGWQIAYRFASL